MSSLSKKDRVSLCSFTFADGRRCRTLRTGKNPHFCFDHTQKEARAHAAESLSKDLAYFFSGDCLSACDLSTALGRLIPAVIRGDVKPRAARTVAYLAQTLMQAIHISQHEYCEAFSSDTWRRSIRNSVRGNHDYLFPPAPKPDSAPAPQQSACPQPQPAPATPVAHPLRGEAVHPTGATSSAQPQTQSPQSEIPALSGPAPSPHTSLPTTSAEFVQQVLAGQNSSRPPQVSLGPGREPGSAAPKPALQSPTTPPARGPVSDHSPTSAAQPAPSSPIQSTTAAQHSPQQQPRPEPHPPVAATPSAPRQEPRPAAGPQTCPSGLPVLAPLPPRKPGASPVSCSS